ncbi:MAG: F0F1 ATP synthase subunit delta [Eubacteriales bacterium]|nr:F0F1 ATP synthase subunit delta [Eubacteriales bacterium]
MSEEAAVTTLQNEHEMEQNEILLLRGRIISGMPLSIAARKRITQNFESMLGCHVQMSTRIDKKLIAGIRVEINGRAYDGSLLGQLTNVRKMLTRHDKEEL